MLLMMLEIWSLEFEDLEFINYRTGACSQVSGKALL